MTTSRATTALLTLTLAASAAFGAGRWRYETSTDPMTDRKTAQASLPSLNRHQLSFPYQGGTQALLTIRQSGNEEPDVYLTVNRGQFLCSATRCKALVRFDEDEALDYQGSSAADGSSEVLFIRSESIFLDKIASAHRLKVEVLMYREGQRIFEFDVSGLEWPPKAQPRASKR